MKPYGQKRNLTEKDQARKNTRSHKKGRPRKSTGRDGVDKAWRKRARRAATKDVQEQGTVTDERIDGL